MESLTNNKIEKIKDENGYNPDKNNLIYQSNKPFFA